ELAAGMLRAPSYHPIGEHNSIHGSGTGPGGTDNVDRIVLKHPVEHAPRESSVRTTSLQSQCDLTGRPFRLRLVHGNLLSRSSIPVLHCAMRNRGFSAVS